ncbi:MAG: helix-turn-helix domain-containing protein [Corallococcus sp.]|nr:helix-turn-helix domain-containing protein [Corallococcus sp.]
MIHAYNEHYLVATQQKLAAMFELAVLTQNIEIDRFASMFLSSPVCKAFETADPIYTLGKSANELLGIVLNQSPINIETNSYASPEYWVGYVLAYAQWYLNKPFAVLINAYPCHKLLNDYFPYHEMDILHSIELFESRLPFENPLKTLRLQKKLSQTQLSLLSGVPLRTIKSYEQGDVDISKAQAETLYALSKTLNCSIENLLV